MRSGGGKDKGNAFERKTCQDLSLWLTGGEMAGVFARNILSGGQFTNTHKKDGAEAGMPGDIMARHPAAYRFLERFAVECKHHKDMNLGTFLFDYRGSSSLARIIAKCQKEAADAGLRPMLIFRQNNRRTQVLLGLEEGQAACAAIAPRLRLQCHILHGQYYLFDFESFRKMVLPDRMLTALPAIKKAP